MKHDPISTFVPGCADPDERRLRERLQKARDMATARAGHLQDGHARQLNWMVVELSSAHVYAPVDCERLGAAADQCLRLICAASAAEYIEGARA